MLDFHHKVSVDILLSNCSVLARFNPQDKNNNAIKLNANGNIEVISKETGLQEIDEITGMLNTLSLTQESRETFATEKKILIWHFSQLIPYLHERLAHLIHLPIDTLRQYHDNSMQLQGFYQLCNNQVLQLSALNESFKIADNVNKHNWSFLFQLLQNSLSNQLENIIADASKLIEQIKIQRKQKLTVNTFDFNLHVFGPLIIPERIERVIPKDYPLGIIKIGEQRYEAKAYFQTFRSTWDTPEKFQFTGKLRFKLFLEAEPMHASVVVYPNWDFQPPTETTESELNKESTHQKLKSLYQTHPIGAIKFEPVNLRANFTELCPHVSANELLPYCATIVDIARSHHMQEVTIFAPYQYSVIMYAYGFQIQPNDLHAPSKEQQKIQVEHAFETGIETPILQQYSRQAQQGNQQLLRPFTLKLEQLDTAPVYLTQSRVKTTYAKLLSRSTMTQHDDCEQGLLPEVLQIPLKFTGILHSLRLRETTGRLRLPAVTFGVEPVTYQSLDNDAALENYALSDSEAAKQSQHSKMLVLRKKRI